jgi:hypothetical protein
MFDLPTGGPCRELYALCLPTALVRSSFALCLRPLLRALIIYACRWPLPGDPMHYACRELLCIMPASGPFRELLCSKCIQNVPRNSTEYENSPKTNFVNQILFFSTKTNLPQNRQPKSDF